LLTLAAALTLVGAASASSSASPVSHGPWSQRLLTRADIASGAVFVPASSSSASASSFLVGFEIGNLCMEPCSEPIVRLDLRSGSFKVGPVLPPFSSIETVGRRVLVFAAHQVTVTGDSTGGFFVRTLNVASFRLGPPVRLHFLGSSGGGVIGVVSGTDDLWIAGSGTLWLWNADTGKVLRRVRVADWAGGGISLSPDGRALYYFAGPSQAGLNSGLFVREISASTGRVLATSGRVADVSTLTPVDRGVWVTAFAVGNASAFLFSSDDLRLVRLPKEVLPPNPQSPHMYAEFSVYDVGPFVLIKSYRGMTCVAPNRGSLRATAVWPTGQVPTWTPVALIGDTLLAIGPTPEHTSEVLKIKVPAACVG